jgi:hypothetical protein
MPLSNNQKMAFLRSLEFISTAVFIGTVSIGFATLVMLLVYNMAFVLAYEARQSPFLAIGYGVMVVLGGLFLAEQMGDPADKDEEVEEAPVVPVAPDTDPLHFEEDPVAL